MAYGLGFLNSSLLVQAYL